MPSRSSSIALLGLALAASALVAACGDDDGPRTLDGGPDTGPPPPDSGPPCPESDGTPMGDCMRFSCLVGKASAQHCTGTGSTVTFNCTGIETFSSDYQSTLATYFGECGPELPTFEPEDVELSDGTTLTVTPCQILKCSTEFESMRMPAPMVIRADCAPVPSPQCDLPDPPMP